MNLSEDNIEWCEVITASDWERDINSIEKTSGTKNS